MDRVLSYMADFWTPMPGMRGFFARPIVAMLLLSCALAIALMWDDKPTYWPAMLTSYFAGATVYFYQARREGKIFSPLQAFFPKEVWLHRSTVEDVIMTFITFVLMSKILYVIVIDPNMFVLTVYRFLASLSLVQSDVNPPFWIICVYVVVSMAASDFFYYISHRLSHEVPVLWQFHKVHHSGEVLTPLTVYRIHPLDSWWNQCFRNVGAGIAAGFFFYFYPSDVTLFVIAGNTAGAYVFHFVAANLRHSHVWISFGPWIERVFISPALHQIHHSDNPKHFDKNYGSVLSLWDWMFGSLYLPQGREYITFGLGTKEHHDEDIRKSLWKMYVFPVTNFIKWVRGQIAA